MKNDIKKNFLRLASLLDDDDEPGYEPISNREFREIACQPDKECLVASYTFKKDALSCLKENQRIRSLGFHCCRGIGDSDLKYIAQIKRLNRLYFCDVEIDGSGLGYLESCPNLMQLYVIHMKIDPKHYPAFSKLKNLRELNIYHSGVTGELLEPVSKCRHLTELDLSFGKLDAKYARYFANMKNLESLCAESLEINDDFMPYIGQMRKLKFLSLMNNKITDRGMKHLAGLHEMDYLALDMNKIGDSSMRYLSELPKLRVLDLSNTNVTDKGLEILSQGPAMKSLTALYLLENKSVSKDTIQLVYEKFPKVDWLQLSENSKLSADMEGERERENGCSFRVSLGCYPFKSAKEYLETYFEKEIELPGPPLFLYTEEEMFGCGSDERLEDDAI